MIKTHTKKGFTLIELILYIGMSSFVLVSAITIGLNLIESAGNSSIKQETYQSSRFALNQLQNKITTADNIITGSSTFDTNPGVLTLDYPGTGTDVVFDTYSQDVTIGGQTISITTLRITEGPNVSVDLTPKTVNVTDFTLTNLTRTTEPKNTGIILSLQSANPSGDPTFDSSITVKTAISLRK